MTMPGVEGIKTHWAQQMGAAKIWWGKLTHDELLETEGHEQRLTALIQARYDISHNEALVQVRDFYFKHKP